MQHAIRFQDDERGDEYDALSVITFDPSKDRARQEFAKETDINQMLKSFGIPGQQRQPQFGEVDFSIDLQQALSAIEDAKRAWRRMPDDIREKYPNWQSMLNAANSGELKVELETAKPPPPVENPPVEPVG